MSKITTFWHEEMTIDRGEMINIVYSHLNTFQKCEVPDHYSTNCKIIDELNVSTQIGVESQPAINWFIKRVTSFLFYVK